MPDNHSSQCLLRITFNRDLFVIRYFYCFAYLVTVICIQVYFNIKYSNCQTYCQYNRSNHEFHRRTVAICTDVEK